MKILIIEDDLELREELKILLDNNGYHGVILQRLDNALEEIIKIAPDLILLDIKLPYLNGQQLLKQLRKKSSIPVIMVTSKDSEMDEILAMSYGADDYITKPYNPTILLLHIEAVFKRLQNKETKLYYQGVNVNLSKSVLEKNDHELLLSKNEMSIFYFLLVNQGKIVSRDEIMNYLWGTNKFIDDNTLTVNMTRLKKKLVKIGLIDVIETRRDQGYILI
ncbi:response regulator transcription factor [[Clostridium] saccharogumia]|uniref:response regulator transcription factor n=1 Tax=Thomasclavelia saccharogumia TaxID=341225 RepID=UPI001D082116|nr:response regulator transcription factor [Thomasclavelia saccharogumia]MCB6707236.1 response regulator transcription factor [Thomasclavelia saccharogumia]